MAREHAAMRSCACREADRLSFVCVACGKIHLFDPSYLILAATFGLIGLNAYWWWTL